MLRINLNTIICYPDLLDRDRDVKSKERSVYQRHGDLPKKLLILCRHCNVVYTAVVGYTKEHLDQAFPSWNLEINKTAPQQPP